MRLISSLAKGIEILEYIGDCVNGAKVSEIAKAFDMPSSNVSLFLNTLVHKRYIIKSELDGKYYISEILALLAQKVSTGGYTDLIIAAQNEMVSLNDEYDENISLAVLNNLKVHFIHVVQSAKRVHVRPLDTELISPHVSAGGKAILAHLPEQIIERYFNIASFDKLTDKSMTTERQVRNELDFVRKNGYAINRGERDIDIMAIAAPIIVGDTVRASLVLELPIYRHDESELIENAQTIIGAAKQISKKI